MEVCLMIEGQEDVTWEDWPALAGAREEHGVGDDVPLRPLPLGRRPTRARPARRWGTITALGAATEKLRLGTMVSPATLDARPKPVQRPLPLILGAKGKPRSLRLAARYADEYNTVMPGPEEVTEIRMGLDRSCEAEGRDPATLPLSMMTGWLVGADREELVDRASRLSQWKARATRRGVHRRPATEHDPRHRG